MNPKVSVILPARHADTLLEETIQTLAQFLKPRFPDSFEILIVPNRPAREVTDKTAEIAAGLSLKYPFVRVTDLLMEPGKGRAVRFGFFASRGEWIFLMDADLPYRLDFFERAVKEFEQGAHFVSGNRRLLESHFDCPVSLLHLVYRRHRMGVRFNFLVRFLLGLKTSDTQCGIKAMTREFAREVFTSLACPGFLADIEYFLVASANNYSVVQMPVHLTLRNEKSTIRLFRETLAILIWLPRLWWRQRRGIYRRSTPFAPPVPFLTADDWGMSPGVNDGILELARRGIVKRVSMMAYGKFVDHGLEELKNIPGVELGLHFDLTSEWSTWRLTPFKWLKLLLGSRKFQELVAEEFFCQWRRLQKKSLVLSYVDGHHHIHVFPGVAPVIAEALVKVGVKWTRLPLDKGRWLGKGVLLNFFSLVSRKYFAKNQVRFHPFYYPNTSQFDLGYQLLSDLKEKSQHEITIHPAAYDDFDRLGLRDSYRKRVWEFGFLKAIFEQDS